MGHFLFVTSAAVPTSSTNTNPNSSISLGPWGVDLGVTVGLEHPRNQRGAAMRVTQENVRSPFFSLDFVSIHEPPRAYDPAMEVHRFQTVTSSQCTVRFALKRQ